MKRIWRSKRGEGYVDLCVGVVVFVMLLVIATNIFRFVTLRVELDEIADELIETAAYTGCFGAEFQACEQDLHDRYGAYTFLMDYDAPEYYNLTYHRVQLGHTMYVAVSVNTDIQGLGIFRIPVTLVVKKSALSEQYWK